MTAERVYLGITHADATSAKTAIREAFNDGVLLAQFSGHGATWRWAHELIWTTTDAQALVNGPMLPVVMTFNCLDGYFSHTDPAQTSMAEAMLRNPNGGSIAAISPTGLGAT